MHNTAKSTLWRCATRALDVAARPCLMGILNVTPDSFSDGGRYADREAARDRALRMVEEGADIIDVGGESTRPGAVAVTADEELARVAPVIAGLRDRLGAETLLSVDTAKAAVARAALAAGADIVNDVTAGLGDPAMLQTVRAGRAGLVLMHRQGTPGTMQDNPSYTDVVAEVCDFLRARAAAAVDAGIARDRIVLDPGIGFGKTLAHNLALLRNLDRLNNLGYPLLVGLSRKRFLGMLTGAEVENRTAASLAALSWCLSRGVAIMRVHDVRASRDAARVIAALMGEGS